MCFCGSSYGKYRQVPMRSCQCRCPGNREQSCGCSLKSAVYKIIPRPDPAALNVSLAPCDQPNVCGAGAVCHAVGGEAHCSCSDLKVGDPELRCCSKLMECGSWGDPHYRTFDGVNFDFMGSCKYQLVTTDCFNQTLPNGLVPFDVRQKNEIREEPSGSFIKYLEITVHGNKYSLNKMKAGSEACVYREWT